VVDDAVPVHHGGGDGPDGACTPPRLSHAFLSYLSQGTALAAARKLALLGLRQQARLQSSLWKTVQWEAGWHAVHGLQHALFTKREDLLP